MDEKRERQFRELGLTISYYRKLKGLTQLQLANAVGLSRTHISNTVSYTQLRDHETDQNRV